MTQTYLKGFQDYLNDDPSLKEKVTYEEFLNKKIAPGNTDDRLDEAYDCFRRFVKEQVEKEEDEKTTL